MKPPKNEVTAMIMLPGIRYHDHRVFIELKPGENAQILGQMAVRDFRELIVNMQKETTNLVTKATGGQMIPLH